jgi:hypothetical protein
VSPQACSVIVLLLCKILQHLGPVDRHHTRNRESRLHEQRVCFRMFIEQLHPRPEPTEPAQIAAPMIMPSRKALRGIEPRSRVQFPRLRHLAFP